MRRATLSDRDRLAAALAPVLEGDVLTLASVAAAGWEVVPGLAGGQVTIDIAAPDGANQYPLRAPVWEMTAEVKLRPGRVPRAKDVVALTATLLEDEEDA